MKRYNIKFDQNKLSNKQQVQNITGYAQINKTSDSWQSVSESGWVTSATGDERRKDELLGDVIC